MDATRYKLTEPFNGFREDELFDVTARFGDWHLYDVRLEAASTYETETIEMTERTLEAIADPVTVGTT